MWIHPSGEIIEYSVSVEQADTKVGLAKQRTRKLSQVVSATKEKQPAQPQKSEAQSGPHKAGGGCEYIRASRKRKTTFLQGKDDSSNRSPAQLMAERGFGK